MMFFVCVQEHHSINFFILTSVALLFSFQNFEIKVRALLTLSPWGYTGACG